MLKPIALTVATIANVGLAAAAENIPATWDDFKASKNKSDTALVAKISKDDWWNVCAKYGRLRRAGKETREFVAYREHLMAEDMLNGKDLMNISKRNVEIGMTTCGAMAALGIPVRSNGTTTARGSRQQLVYQNNYRYVYTEDSRASRTGIVTAIQD